MLLKYTAVYRLKISKLNTRQIKSESAVICNALRFPKGYYFWEIPRLLPFAFLQLINEDENAYGTLVA
jgi:hypothetical protein